MIVRIAHLSDTHLGYRALAKSHPDSGRNQRAVDIERAFGWAIDDLLTRNVDLVIHSGDLFHHSRPVFPAIGAAIRQFRKVERQGIPAVVIAGNHDTPRLRTTGSVYGLLESALPEVHFFGGYEDIDPFELAGIMVTVVPHGRLTNPEPPSVYPVANQRNVLITHGFVPNMPAPVGLRETGDEEIGEYLLDSAFDYIALGHYHLSGQARPNAWYAGSTERIGWGDLETEPGYLIINLGEKGVPPVVERIPVPIARPMLTHTIPEQIAASQDGVSIAEYAIKWLEAQADPAAMTRIVLPDVPRSVRRHVDSLVREVAELHVWSVQVTGRPFEASAISFQHPDLPTLSLLDQFAAFISAEQESSNFDPIFAASFARVGRRELEAAQAAMEAQLTTEGSA